MKVALVTGASRGIGKKTALRLARQKIGVILTYNSHPDEAITAVDEIKKAGGRAAALKLDVAKAESFDAFVSQVTETLSREFSTQKFDILINNAGNAQRTPIKDTTFEQFDDIVDVHVKGPFFLSQKLIPHLNDGGHIVFISSALTRMTHPAGVAVYAAAKGAVEVLTRYFAAEYASRKIRANCVAPGALDTDFGGGRSDEQRQAIASHVYAGRIGVAEDIAAVLESVVSENCTWINGQRIEATGGS